MRVFSFVRAMPEVVITGVVKNVKKVTIKPCKFVQEKELIGLTKMDGRAYVQRFGLNRKRTIDGILHYAIAAKDWNKDMLKPQITFVYKRKLEPRRPAKLADADNECQILSVELKPPQVIELD